jgi:hypothetical protein
MMGVNIPANNFDSVDVLRELECAKYNLCEKNNVVDKNLVVGHDNGPCTPLVLPWHDIMVDDLFTIVESRRSKKRANKKKSHVAMSRPMTRSQGHVIVRPSSTINSALAPRRNGRKREISQKLKF